MIDSTTDAELTVLGLLTEKPRHGYELEHVIAERGVRAWTALGFSSIYYILDKLAKRGLIEVIGPASAGKSRTTFRPTPTGFARVTADSLGALAAITPVHARVLVGLANSPGLSDEVVVAQLRERARALEAKLQEVAQIRASQQPHPPAVAAIFDFSESMLRADHQWTITTIAALTTPDTHNARDPLTEGISHGKV